MAILIKNDLVCSAHSTVVYKYSLCAASTDDRAHSLAHNVNKLFIQ